MATEADKKRRKRQRAATAALLTGGTAGLVGSNIGTFNNTIKGISGGIGRGKYDRRAALLTLARLGSMGLIGTGIGVGAASRREAKMKGIR